MTLVKVIALALLFLSLNLKESNALFNKNISTLSYDISDPPDPIDIINDLANSQLSGALLQLLDYLDPESGEVVGIVVEFIKAFTAGGGGISPETQMILDAIDRQTQILMDALNQIADMINTMADQLIIQFDKLLFEQKYQGLTDNINRINSAYNTFGLLLKSYTQKDELVFQLKKFVQDTRDKHYDFEIVEPVTNDENNGGSQSIISSYISFIIHNDVGLKCTPNQQIGWFYNHVLDHAHKINVLLLATYELLENIEKTDYTSDKTYISNKIKFNTDAVKIAVNRTFTRYSDKTYLSSVQHKITNPEEDKNFVQMNRLFYDYFAYEEDIAQGAGSGDTCTGTCEDYADSRISDSNRCAGYAVKCESFSNAILLEENSERRLYSGYSNGNTWFGDENGPGNRRTMQGYTSGFVYCDVCRCTCENAYGYGVKRWFYMDSIPPPSGYVIIGVRTAEKRGVFFLQPQVAKLIGVGRVDLNTTKWLDVPDPVKSGSEFKDTFTLHYGDDNVFTLGSTYLSSDVYVTEVRFAMYYPSSYERQLAIETFGRKVIVGNNKVKLGDFLTYVPYDDETKAYITFKKSSREKDAGQHYEPMFDSQDINMNDPLPLNGMSVYHYKTSGQTQNSFIAWQLTAVDVQKRTV